ncbi:MAG: hypothetical protein EOO65_00505 [Methanosarcinales archaeon]|nr:MAG: hypothetical protein EOO65_00505 [Methanosarcinales archaeon]
MIYRLLLSPHKRTIIYAAKKEGKTYVIKPDEPVRHKASVECLSELSVMSDLGPDPVIIADSFVPPVLPYPTFVLSSPGVLFKEGMRDTLNEYHDAYLYMPIYSEEELIHLWRRAFSGLDEGVRRRLNLWGPIPRHVLVKHEPKKQSALVNASLAILLEKIIAVARGQYMSAAGGRGEELDVPHRIVHERAAGQDAKPGSKAADPRNEEFYQRGVVITSSAAFARHLTEQMIGCQNWNAAFLVDTTARIGALGGLRGCRFEEIAVDLLLLGGTFKVRNLTTNVETTLKLPASDRVEWADVAQLPELKDTRGTLVPTIRNAAGLDALIWSEKGCYMPLDCTVSPEHGFHAEGVSNAVRALGWKQEHGWPCMKALRRTIVQKRIVYCWVVPQDQFDSSWWSPKVAKPGTDATKEAQEVVAHMTQFALCIPRLTSLKALSELFASNAVPKPTELVSEG